MKNSMKYKGYYGSVEYSDVDECFHGKVVGIDDLILFEGDSVKELKHNFQEVVDIYIEDCKACGKVPQKCYKGSFNVRIGTDLHRSAAIMAVCEGITLNTLVEQAIRAYLAKEGKKKIL